MEVQLAQLRALQAVVRHASFSRAADELHLTQPAVSMQIRQLEDTVGLPLLERVGKRAFLTQAGEVLLAHATRALRELQTGLELVQQLRGVVAGRIRLGTSASISIYLLPPLLRRFRSRYPDTGLIVVTGNAPEIRRAVVANELDIGVVSLPVRERELVVTPLHRDEIVAIAPPGSKWRKLRVATPAQLAGESLILFEQGGTIRGVIDGWFRAAGVSPGLPMELGNTEAIKKLVGAGLGLSITSGFTVREEAKAGTLAVVRLEPSLFREIGVIHRKDKPRTPALDAFLAALGDLHQALGARSRAARKGRVALG
jgi:DNA-binding transcriptional LysR family regulator